LPNTAESAVPAEALSELKTTVAELRSAPCYLILCDGDQAVVLEKDLTTAKVHTSDEFIVHTNHDTDAREENKVTGGNNQKDKTMLLGMEELLEESEERHACVRNKWENLKKRHVRRVSRDGAQSGEKPYVREETLKNWVKAYPTMNESTHFGCVLDPKRGEIRFLERGTPEVRAVDEETGEISESLPA
jgi:hypothetical protein